MNKLSEYDFNNIKRELISEENKLKVLEKNINILIDQHRNAKLNIVKKAIAKEILNIYEDIYLLKLDIYNLKYTLMYDYLDDYLEYNNILFYAELKDN